MLFKGKRLMPASPAAGVDHPSLPDDPDVDLKSETRDHLARLARGDYDFLDLGTLDGGGFGIAELQGGRRGLGFELSAAAVRNAKAKGWDVALHDVCLLQPMSPLVDFAVCSHILEHLPDLERIEGVIASLASLSRRYILIAGPCFETEAYLEGLDLKVLHSLMIDHTCKMKVSDLIAILHRLELRDFVVALGGRMHDSDNMWIHSAAQTVPPEGLWTYDADKHLPKKRSSFDRELFRDFVCVVKLSADVDLDGILSKYYWGFDKIVDRSSWAF